MKRHGPAWAHRPASCTMTLLRLCLQVGPLTRGVCFLDHCDSSEPAGEPHYASHLTCFVCTSFTSFISLRHFQVPTYQVRQYHAIVSLAERDVNTCLVMEQRPQVSDNMH